MIELKYGVTRTSSYPVSKQCPYNKEQRIYRYCLDNFPSKSKWTKTDLTQCQPRANTKLKVLNAVSENSIYVSSCFFLFLLF